MKKPTKKDKLLILQTLLQTQSDADHPLPAVDIMRLLAEEGIDVTRQTVYADVETLIRNGMDIDFSYSRTNGGYFLRTRAFEPAELKLMADAVASSRFISEQKSAELIGKIAGLGSDHQADSIRRQVMISGRVRALSGDILENIDLLHEAVRRKKKIGFRYFDYDLQKKRVFRKNRQEYVRTPVCLVWNDDSYYLVSYSLDHPGGFASYRVDRMTEIRLLEEKSTRIRKTEAEKYVRKSFGMFAGETITAHILFHKDLANLVMDRFGAETVFYKEDSEHFSVFADVSLSPVFLSWLFGLGNRAKIISPPHLVYAMRVLLDENAALYREDEEK